MHDRARRSGTNAGGGTSAQGVPGKRTLTQGIVRRRAVAGAGAEGAAEGAAVPDARAGAGAPLDAGVRERLETSYGADLGAVRVHEGPAAAASASSIGAEAYTRGADVFVGARGADFGLLAHEVAHVVQGGGGHGLGAADAPEEHEADRAASAATRGERAEIEPRGGGDVVRRRGVPDVIAQDLGSVQLSSVGQQRGVSLIARHELVPADRQPGQFDGYTGVIQAVVRGREVQTTSVVVRDRDGRYHVFDTGLTPLPARAPDGGAWQKTESLTSQQGVFEGVRVVRLFEEQAVDFGEANGRAQGEWSAMHGEAPDPARTEGGRSHYRRAQAGYEDEVRSIVGNDMHVGHRDSSASDDNDLQDTPGAEILVDVRPNNLDGARALARSGIPDAAGPGLGVREAPDPAVARPRFNREGLIDRNQSAVAQTLIHEGTHVGHAERTLELRHRWQARGGGVSFDAWLLREQRAGRLGVEEVTVARQALLGETSGIEIMARVEAFTSTYDRLPPDDPAAFVQFSTLAEYWVPVMAPDSLIEPIRRIALDRLFHYYEHALDEPHRAAFDRFVASPGNFGGGADDRPEFSARGRATLVPALQAFRGRLAAPAATGARGS
jgi:hypothetical protein